MQRHSMLRLYIGTLDCTRGLVTLLRRWISLKDSERVPFRIDEVSLPAHARDGKLGQGNLAASAHDLCCRRIKVHHLHRADEGVGSVLGRRCLCRTLQQPAAGSFRLNPPIFNREPFSSAKSPAKNLAVKANSTPRIISLDFEIVGRVHDPSIIEAVRESWPSPSPRASRGHSCAGPNSQRQEPCRRFQCRAPGHAPAPQRYWRRCFPSPRAARIPPGA